MKDVTDTKTTKIMYDKYAKDYHAGIFDKRNVWHKYVEKPIMTKFLKPEIRGKVVLDLGCGSGPFIKRLLSLESKKVKGIDLSEELIKIAKRENPKVEFYVGDAQKTPFKKEEFEVVTSSLMAHYIKNLDRLFREVSRILKKGGLFVFSMHHPIMEVSGRLKINGRKSKTKAILKPYFHNDKYNWKLKEKMNMIAYHHTFEMIFEALNENGFIIENLAEPRASKKTEKINKEVYRRTNMRPSFLIIKARKIK